MRALSITQPWATLIAIGAKSVETRSWGTTYSGPLAIHASKNYPEECREFFDAVSTLDLCGDALDQAGYHSAGDVPLGAIVAVANLARCFPFINAEVDAAIEQRYGVHLDARERMLGDFSPGRFGFLLLDVRRLPVPVPCAGALGLWTVPPETMAAVQQQLQG